MGMSTHIVAFRQPDEKWNKMKAVWVACEKAGVSIPRDVEEFFNHENPNDKMGMEVKINKALSGWGDGSRQGYEVDLEKLPKDVKILRFYNSY